ncbi:Do family serine endopeptidase [Rhizobium paknamense]|uniref:Probable periplasmic serine endoprotease DegP-like n=1 Tax=Rhizobium paknamense TaxID=1206817 RepID=A0ABU0I9D0_9HYPH|nr:Do family serine endopeptidase [Rhizobium paknamense]MDQ0454846.1 serine protease Do [Rhizobium paknamense]
MKQPAATNPRLLTSLLVAGAVMLAETGTLQAQSTMGAQPGGAPAAASKLSGPAPVSDIAEGLLQSVVNIATSQNVKDDDAGPMPQVPKGSPFEDLFEDFFKNRGGEGSNHKVNSLGSGFVIDPAGYIVTNNHVIENADDIEVIFSDGSKLKATLVGTDTKTDLSLLKVDSPEPLKAVKFGDSKKMRIGDWVMAIGNPFGLGGSVTLGIVSARGRNINAGPYDNFIQTDAAINKGNSGGPLFNMAGEVIGINTAIISPSGGSIGIGFAVPTELAQNVIDQLRQYGETRRGWLGVRIQPVPDELAKSAGIKPGRGALVSSVIDGGPSANGPLKAGDVVISFNGKDIMESRDLVRSVAESPIDQDLEAVIFRDGKRLTVKVKLARLQDEKTDAKTDEQADPKAPEGNGEQQEDADKTVLGLGLVTLDDENRAANSIAESVEGLLITSVEPGSQAEQKGLKPGEVIVEVAQEFVDTPEAMAEKLAKLKNDGRRSAHLMVANARGDLRFVAIPLE